MFGRPSSFGVDAAKELSKTITQFKTSIESMSGKVINTSGDIGTKITESLSTIEKKI